MNSCHSRRRRDGLPPGVPKLGAACAWASCQTNQVCFLAVGLGRRRNRPARFQGSALRILHILRGVTWNASHRPGWAGDPRLGTALCLALLVTVLPLQGQATLAQTDTGGCPATDTTETAGPVPTTPPAPAAAPAPTTLPTTPAPPEPASLPAT